MNGREAQPETWRETRDRLFALGRGRQLAALEARQQRRERVALRTSLCAGALVLLASGVGTVAHHRWQEERRAAAIAATLNDHGCHLEAIGGRLVIGCTPIDPTEEGFWDPRYDGVPPQPVVIGRRNYAIRDIMGRRI